MKRKSIFGIFLLLLSCSLLRAQYVVSVLPPPTVFGLEDLWHFTITKVGNTNHDVYQATIRVYDPSANLLLESVSQPFQISNGSKYVSKLNLQDLAPLMNTATPGSPLENLAGTGGYFPAGVYNFQYLILGRDTLSGQFEQLAEELGTQTVDLLFPPSLLMPFDNDTLDTYYPLFAWAPGFSGSGDRIFYELLIVEEQPGQTAEQALNSNPEFFKQGGLTTTALPYPPSATSLEPNQWYDWRVTAYVNNQPMARSESWRFIIVEPQPDTCKPKPAEQSFELKKEINGAYALVTDGQLNFNFEEKYEITDDKLKYTIYNQNKSIVATEQTLPFYKSVGFNEYTILLCSDGINLGMGRYLLEIMTEKSGKLYLLFHVINNNSPCLTEESE